MADKIVYWYDRHTRCWVVQVLDDNGYEIECSFTGNKISRDAEIEYLKSEYCLRRVEHI